MVAIGGGAAESVATSPECERWIADYRQKLAQARPVHAVETQNKRLKKYVKLCQIIIRMLFNIEFI